MTDNRVPAGVPTGGQFATSARAESGTSLAPASSASFGDGVANQALVARLSTLMAERGASDQIRAEDGTYPGSVRLNGPYEGELLDIAEACAQRDLYVSLRDGQDLYGDPEDGFEFTVSDNDRYGSHDTWITGEIC